MITAISAYPPLARRLLSRSPSRQRVRRHDVGVVHAQGVEVHLRARDADVLRAPTGLGIERALRLPDQVERLLLLTEGVPPAGRGIPSWR
jgi:hypothetical protein